ncbi:MAG: hypothetical protein ACOCVF_00645 [bacterium]
MMIPKDSNNGILTYAREVLKYYANENNYKNIDNGEQARNALKLIDQMLESFEKIENFNIDDLKNIE